MHKRLVIFRRTRRNSADLFYGHILLMLAFMALPLVDEVNANFCKFVALRLVTHEMES